MLVNSTQGRSALTLGALRSRVDRLFTSVRFSRNSRQEELALDCTINFTSGCPTESLSGFIDFLADAVPQGNIYLFGGVLRDLALYGKRGFNSDIDIVVDGDWAGFVEYLEYIGAGRNKFGGYRFSIGEWPIDVWNAEDTWAIREGLVPYNGVASLIKTTVLNWDAILMNWKTKYFICDPTYLQSLRERAIDVVLERNPNPLGAAVRVLRHLSSKDARRIGRRAAAYLERCTLEYSFEEIFRAEIESYRNSLIEPALYDFFSEAANIKSESIEQRLNEAEQKLQMKGEELLGRQFDLGLKV
jgi:hypothetical protein